MATVQDKLSAWRMIAHAASRIETRFRRQIPSVKRSDGCGSQAEEDEVSGWG
jgi:hypothetical protein